MKTKKQFAERKIKELIEELYKVHLSEAIKRGIEYAKQKREKKYR